MNPTSLVAMRQAPLRQAYTADPSDAISVKVVRTVQTATTDALHGTVESPEYPGVSLDYGIDHKVGGLHDLPNPGHILCAALAGCLDSTVRMLCDHAGVTLEDLEVEVTGDVDVRGCLAMERTVRTGFRQLACTIRARPAEGTDPRVMDGIVAYAERLCVTLETLRNGVPITVDAEITQPSAGDGLGDGPSLGAGPRPADPRLGGLDL